MVENVREKVLSGDYRFSDHSLKMMVKRSIYRSEVEDAIINGEVIESYPDDKYSPSCLIYGKTKEKRDLHVQVSSPPEVVIITVYEPESDKWSDCRIRIRR